MMRNRIVVGVSAAAAGIGVLLAVGVTRSSVAATNPTTPASSMPATTRTITVTGHGEASGVPDAAELSLGVSSRAKSAAGALSAMSDRANKLIGVIKDAGVADKDVQTSGLSLQPTTDDAGQITGYEANTTVVAKIRDNSKVGPTIDAATTQVGDDIRLDGVIFSITDTSSLMSAARAEAVTRARTRADELAKAAGLQLGDVQSITEGSTPTALPLAAGAAAAAAVPIQPGIESVSVDESITFAIR